jgi:hypothetical protein
VRYTVNANLFIEANSPQQAAERARQRNDLASQDLAYDDDTGESIPIEPWMLDTIAVVCVMVVQPGSNIPEIAMLGEDPRWPVEPTRLGHLPGKE